MDDPHLTPVQMILQARDRALRDLQGMGMAENQVEQLEPAVPEKLEPLGDSDLRRLYDELLRYNSFLINRMARLRVYKTAASNINEHVSAELTLAASREKSLTNAELRKAWVTSNPAMVSAIAEKDYFTHLYSALSDKKDAIRYVLRRVYQELFFRGVRLPGGDDEKEEGSQGLTTRNNFAAGRRGGIPVGRGRFSG